MGIWSDEKHFVMKHLICKLGMSVSEVAESLSVDPQTVRYWSRRPPPSQRVVKRLLSERDRRRIAQRRSRIKSLVKEVRVFNRVKHSPVFHKPSFRVIRRKPFRTCGRIRRELGRRWGINVSTNTVRNDLLFLGLRARRQGRGPYLSQKDRDNRVAFCRSELSLGSNLMFSDEKWLLSNDNGCGWQWVSPGEYPDIREMCQEADRICLWGIICPGFRYLRISYGTVKKQQYLKYLEEALPHILRLQGADPTLYWQQDNAPAHSGTLDFLESRGVRVKRHWPPRSCDINVIENLWQIIQSRVSDEGPWSRDELVEYVSKVWRELDTETTNRLCGDYHGRLRKVVERRGATIRP